MTIQRQQLGRSGEEAAAEFLKQRGYQILGRNFRSKNGEIDIIAQDKDTLCFVEVRTRTADWHGHPFESISMNKIRKIIHTARVYLLENDISSSAMRFDVVAVMPDDEGTLQMELLKNAFETN